MTPTQLRNALRASTVHLGSETLSYASENTEREASVVTAVMGGYSRSVTDPTLAKGV